MQQSQLNPGPARHRGLVGRGATVPGDARPDGRALQAGGAYLLVIQLAVIERGCVQVVCLAERDAIHAGPRDRSSRPLLRLAISVTGDKVRRSIGPRAAKNQGVAPGSRDS